MKLRIDPGSCQGHGRCYMLYPELVTTGDEGFGHPVSEDITEDQREAAEGAVANCPERAITLE